ncbi:hypothetical protein LMG28688_00806 [Paraburkholderia caffeinitolerans]|uniref:Uncharacterized protein n=1 Tax=Paraburkholderia caffeinitolerans TaxID=1723730 RepID=A0A6J5FJJ5_9BURK|nr:hypothetical protein [Paraburkholderia caffeinitolerans]CAB3779329.1 hypothetical protein LMG28688_00806 [Paraburkholderia caffeinitolerans]
MSAAPGSEPIAARFRLRFEYLGPNEEIVRTEHVYGADQFLSLQNAESAVAKKAIELQEKIINALREDGTIPPPSNVIKVDFIRGKRV